WRRMSSEAATSEWGGQLWITLFPGARMAAARMGKTLFLAPWTSTPPTRGRPPSTMIACMAVPPRSVLLHPMAGEGWGCLSLFAAHQVQQGAVDLLAGVGHRHVPQGGAHGVPLLL